MRRKVTLGLMLAAMCALAFGPLAGAQVIATQIGLAPPDQIAPSSQGAGPTPSPQGAPPFSNMLVGVPNYVWTYGCSPTSTAMIFGYYDQAAQGYSNMYVGPSNDGVAPPTGGGPTDPLFIATANGQDGRTTPGHVDDYWDPQNPAGPDPWTGGSGVEHTWGDCTADYMGTNQWKWDFSSFPGAPDGATDSNKDGITTLFTYHDGRKLPDYQPNAHWGTPHGWDYGTPDTALCHGLRLFAESRGYSVVENYTQNADRLDPLDPEGFSFADYMNEIDSGRPPMIQVTGEDGQGNPVGHSMVGVGYDDPDGIPGTVDDLIHFHNAWGGEASMPWNGTYSGYNLQIQAFTVIQLSPLESGVIPEPTTLCLLGAGLLGVIARRRRRRPAA